MIPSAADGPWWIGLSWNPGYEDAQVEFWEFVWGVLLEGWREAFLDAVLEVVEEGLEDVVWRGFWWVFGR